MKVDVLLGLQWGDEGKGKITDVLTPQYDIIARFQGGPNAGHTLEFDGGKHVLHTIPSGIFHPEKMNVIGNGVIIDPYILANEIKKLREKNVEPEKNLVISKRAHLITPTHRALDFVYESAKGASKIGSTLKGIGPSYTDKVSRAGIRIGNTIDTNFRDLYEEQKKAHFRIINSYGFVPEEIIIDKMPLADYEKLWFEGIEYLKDIPHIDSEIFINESIKAGKRILAEGAQGAMLDIDYGTYPYVTSSNTITAGVCAGLGISPQKVGRVFGVFKAYCTRVGSGPFPSELLDATGNTLRIKGNEFGSTTGRPRRCGWIDIPAMRYSIMLNGVTDLVMMKADVLDELDKIGIVTQYEVDGDIFNLPHFETITNDCLPVVEYIDGWKQEISDFRTWDDLPESFTNYIDFLERNFDLPISVISLGPGRIQTIIRQLKQEA
ncbi:MAG TPA: adenylosuccinate synthase [Lentimicrobium sp.]|nr:adenylosuccinate synthase [Lentimicrobium sp.]